MKPIKLPGKQYDIVVSLPWETGVFIRLELYDRSGVRLESWEKKIPPEVMVKYISYIVPAKILLSVLMK